VIANTEDPQRGRLCLEAQPFFFLNCKGTPSQEDHETIFSGLRITNMALSGQIDSPVVFRSSEIEVAEFL
jgi:hypothetical protein